MWLMNNSFSHLVLMAMKAISMKHLPPQCSYQSTCSAPIALKAEMVTQID